MPKIMLQVEQEIRDTDDLKAFLLHMQEFLYDEAVRLAPSEEWVVTTLAMGQDSIINKACIDHIHRGERKVCDSVLAAYSRVAFLINESLTSRGLGNG